MTPTPEAFQDLLSAVRNQCLQYWNEWGGEVNTTELAALSQGVVADWCLRNDPSGALDDRLEATLTDVAFGMCLAFFVVLSDGLGTEVLEIEVSVDPASPGTLLEVRPSGLAVPREPERGAIA